MPNMIGVTIQCTTFAKDNTVNFLGFLRPATFCLDIDLHMYMGVQATTRSWELSLSKDVISTH